MAQVRDQAATGGAIDGTRDVPDGAKKRPATAASGRAAVVAASGEEASVGALAGAASGEEASGSAAVGAAALNGSFKLPVAGASFLAEGEEPEEDRMVPPRLIFTVGLMISG